MSVAENNDGQPSIEDRAGRTARNGWGPLPLPTGKKSAPPTGMTGDTPMPSYADWWTYYESSPDAWGNLGVRIPPGVIGVDVDAYNGKHGAATWELLGGKDWPDTVVLSSRFRAGYDGTSGIRFYRLPESVTEADLWGAHDGIEILKNTHRYAVAPGSTHPEGGTYQAVDLRTRQFIDVLPPVAELPELTPDQAVLLTKTGAPWAGQVIDTGPRQRDDQAACDFSRRITYDAIDDLKNKSSRYDRMRDAVHALVRGEDEGHHLGVSLDMLKLAYVAATVKDRKDAGMEHPSSEFDRCLAGARALVAQDPTDPMFKGCCESSDIALPGENIEPEPELDDDDDDVADWDTSSPEPKPATNIEFDKAVRKQYVELRIRDEAKQRFQEWAAGEIEPISLLTWPDFADQPEEDTAYRVHGLWPAQGRVVLSAAAKTGKTTLVAANLIPCLLRGGEFLGRFEVQPVTGSVVYLNMEVGPNTLRNWMQIAGVPRDPRLIVANLRGKASSLTVSTEAGRRSIADMLKAVNAEVVILDPLAPVLASLGLEENSNFDVARFFAWWAETLDMAGVVDDLIVHHTGHTQERARGASRLNDEPDAIWTLSKSEDEVQDELDEIFAGPGGSSTRFLKAFGRDVDMPSEALEHDPQTHALTLTGQRKGQEGTTRTERRVIAYMSREGTPKSRNQIVKAVGGKREIAYAAIDALLDSGELVDSGAKSGNGYPLLILGTA